MAMEAVLLKVTLPYAKRFQEPFKASASNGVPDLRLVHTGALAIIPRQHSNLEGILSHDSPR